jgi:uncharacterized protein YjbJ (UPF0337 family)
MNEDRVVGTAKNIGGQVEEGIGRATRDYKTQAEGRISQAAGAAQDLYGQARDAAEDLYGQARDAAEEAAKAVQERAAPLEQTLRSTIEDRPYTAVFTALAIGWILGRMGHSG